MDATKEQPRRRRQHDDFIHQLIRKETRELTPCEIDEMERELQELVVVEEFLRRIAPELAMTEDY